MKLSAGVQEMLTGRDWAAVGLGLVGLGLALGLAGRAAAAGARATPGSAVTTRSPGWAGEGTGRVLSLPGVEMPSAVPELTRCRICQGGGCACISGTSEREGERSTCRVNRMEGGEKRGAPGGGQCTRKRAGSSRC